MQTGQLPLGFHLKEAVSFDNFCMGRNRELISALKQSASGTGEQVIYIAGKHGQGMSHLLKSCCHYAYQHQVSSAYLPLNQLITLSKEILIGYENLKLICVDDLQSIAGHEEWEEAFFHLYNRIYDAGGHIVIGGKALPKSLGFKLQDVTSRLSWGVTYHLYPLSDTEKLSILISRATERGMVLSEEVANYMLTHCPRHMSTLIAALDVLDQASLAAKRKLTIPFVKEILEI